jgi:hypothetical protein
MTSRIRFVLPVILFALAVLAGCGSSSTTVVTPPGGGYSNSDLNGTYVFSFTGTDAVNGGLFAMAGTFTAGGSGGISGGTVDIIDPGYSTTPFTGVAIQSSSSYAITTDGRGRGVLVTNISSGTYSGLASIGIDFVLTSSSHGLIVRFDGDGTGSGTLDLQSSSITQSSLTNYAFTLSGVDDTDGGLEGNPFFSVGEFALNSSGTITSGLQDFNDDRNSTNLTDLALAGSLTLASSGPGTAQLATSSPYGTLTFDVWAIDATHFKLIETDGLEWLAGDAFTQQTTLAAGQLVYTLSGWDTSNYAFASGGYMTYDGSSVISNGYEDMNDSGTYTSSQTASGYLTTAGDGRYVMTLNGLYNGVNSSVGSYTFVGYPFASGGNTGMLVLETDGLGITGGTAFAQTATTFASDEGFGLNETGANSGGEVDLIAEFATESGGTLSAGIMDENDDGSYTWKESLGSGGGYTFIGSGRGTLSYSGYGIYFYVANSSTIPFIDADTDQVGVGVFEQQSAQSTSDAKSQAAALHTQTHLAVLRAAAKKAKKK